MSVACRGDDRDKHTSLPATSESGSSEMDSSSVVVLEKGFLASAKGGGRRSSLGCDSEKRPGEEVLWLDGGYGKRRNRLCSGFNGP